jgi:uncharacterized coiled-coil DUF342 family protein
MRATVYGERIMPNHSGDLWIGGTVTLVAGAAVTLLLGQSFPKAAIAGVATAGSGIGIAALQTSRMRSAQEKEQLEQEKAQVALQAKISTLQEKLQEKSAAIQFEGQLEELQQKVDWQRGEESRLEDEIRQAELQLGQSRGEFAELQKRGELVRAEQQEIKGQVEAQKRSLSTIEATLTPKQQELEQLIKQITDQEQQLKQLQEQSARLELERTLFDGLLQERERLEARIEQLRPEQKRLEEELQRLLREIRDNVPDHNRIAELRQEINALEQQRRGLRRDANTLEARIAQMGDEQVSLEAKVRELNEKMKGLEGDSHQLVEFALQALKMPLWKVETLPTSPLSFANEDGFIRSFESYVASQGFSFPSRVIRAFHTALKVQGISALVVLAGISGTGKSELPQLYADFIGAQFLSLPVQPRWDSPQDLSGFYNYVENKFKPTSLLRGIYQYPQLGGDRIVIVLLDEMNLARVEYYFSDFLSKLESRRNHPENARLEIDLGSLPIEEAKRKFPIPQQFLFVGTMNEDETTQTLSDKVLDRANVLTFGRPKDLKLNDGKQNREKRPYYVSYSQFNQWFVPADVNSDAIRKVSGILDRMNVEMEAMGHPFAHRVYQAIATYVANYPGASDPNSEAFRSAIADQFAQKLLPKLRGVMVHEEHNQQALKRIGDIIATEINDSALQEAFNKAKEGQYGQFHWKGLIYPEA